jgi:PmbA protein
VIADLLAAVRRRAQAGDALWRREERTAIAFESGRLKSAGVTEEAGVNLRVVKDGRVGVAGTTAAASPAPGSPDGVLERALASAALGETVSIAFPAAAKPPSVPTYFDRAADASLGALTTLGGELVERLTRDGCQLNVSVEREVAEVEVGNTAGAVGNYRSTGVGVGVDLTRIAGDDVLMVYDQYVGADLPTDGDVEALVRSVGRRLELALRVVEPPDGALPVVFTPMGLAAILLPLEQALSGKAVLQGVSPLAGKVGTRVFDERLSLTDDPLAAGRAGSRPFDDEGVPSRALPLVARGVVEAFAYDLETATRAGTASTGHGRRRSIFGKPHIAYTNLVVADDARRTTDDGLPGGGLAAGLQDGLIVEDLIGVGQGNVIGGSFSHPVALAYRVERGEITGRVKDAAVAGKVYELLARIGGWGGDGRWLGSRYSPSLLLEGVSVARR